MIDEDETRMIDTPGSVRHGGSASMNGKWGAPAVGIHSVGDTHFGDTHVGDTQFGMASLVDESVSAHRMLSSGHSHSQRGDAASAVGSLEPFKASVRTLSVHRDPDATPIHAPDPELLRALNLSLVPSGTPGIGRGVNMIEPSAMATQTTHAQSGLRQRFRRFPTPVLGMFFGGALGLVSASLIPLQKREVKELESVASPTSSASSASEGLTQDVVAHEEVSSPKAGGAEAHAVAPNEILALKAATKPDPVRSPEAVLAGEFVLDELASVALSHHFGGRCSAARSAYARLESSVISLEDQKMWRDFARASAATCVILSQDDSL